MRFETKMDACRAWIGSWNSIPQALIERAYKDQFEDFECVAGGERKSDCCDADVEAATDEDDETVHRCANCDCECEVHWSGSSEGWLPMWGTMFNPSESFDERWIEANADEIAEKCGLLIYRCGEIGVLVGIDGAGYDFFADHWLKLYELRGLEWHEGASAEGAPTGSAEG